MFELSPTCGNGAGGRTHNENEKSSNHNQMIAKMLPLDVIPERQSEFSSSYNTNHPSKRVNSHKSQSKQIVRLNKFLEGKYEGYQYKV